MDKDRSRLLIVDDEKKICEILHEILHGESYEVVTALKGQNALEKMRHNSFDLILLDIKLPDISGIDILKTIKKQYSDTSVVMISAFGTVSLAVEAIKNGADDFIEKPLETNRVLTTIRNVLEKKELKRQSHVLKTEVEERYRIRGNSDQIKKVIEFMDRVATTNSTVLIVGESGVGKELVARGIHWRSNRAARPFVKVNCAALPADLIESELFGYEKGAFTGARSRKLGQFEVADGGTLFLDEIGDMPLSAQAKVLRAIEENEVLRLGSTKSLKIDVRIVAATNKDLNAMIDLKIFRDDLYHRINVLNITVPPLRDRKEDIPLLADFFLQNACVENNISLKHLSHTVIKFLQCQKWPGNIRELKHLMEKAAILVDTTQIDDDDIAAIMQSNSFVQNGGRHVSIDMAKDEFEKNHIVDTLDTTDWQISKAAKKLGINRSTLFRKMKKYRIERKPKLQANCTQGRPAFAPERRSKGLLRN